MAWYLVLRIGLPVALEPVDLAKKSLVSAVQQLSYSSAAVATLLHNYQELQHSVFLERQHGYLWAVEGLNKLEPCKLVEGLSAND